MTIRKTLLFVLAVLFAAALVTLLFFQDLMYKVRAQMKLSVKNQCEDEVQSASATKENPNKALFVSCGGFLE